MAERNPVPQLGGLALAALLGLACLFLLAITTQADSPTVTNTQDSGPGSLRQAIADAVAGDTVAFALVYPATITLTSGELVISKPLTIAGPGPDLLAVSGNGSSRVFRVDDTAEPEPIAVTILGLTIRDGHPPSGSGGGLLNMAHLILEDTILRYNTASGGGGMSNGDRASLTNVRFYDNSALSNNAGNGGALVTAGRTTLTDVTFSGNYSDEYGGAMSFYSVDSVTLTNVLFVENSARLEGGAMRIGYGASPTLSGVVFQGNSARFGGGMSIYIDCSPKLTDVSFVSNWAESGGGISSVSSSPMLIHVTFRGNSATDGLYGGRGGGMYGGGSATLVDVIFSDNTARLGGGMYNGGSPTLTDVTFSGNSAENGGGGMYNSGGSPVLTNVVFRGNSADYGGGMASAESSPVLTNVVFSGNSATSGGNVAWGGGMQNARSSPTLTNVTLGGNVAGIGGGIYNLESHCTIQNSILWGNRAISATHQIYNDGVSTPTIAHSDIEGSGGSGGDWDSTLGTDLGGNIDAHPRFRSPVDPAGAPTIAGNLRLWAGSPAIDAGDNGFLSPGVTTDLDGRARVYNGTVDMGAYEAQSFAFLYLPVLLKATAP